MICPECEGEGIVEVGGIEVECPVCDGRGTIRDEAKQGRFPTYKERGRK